MREFAAEKGVTIHDPQSINSEEAFELLRSFDADLYVVCDYGQILSRQVLQLPRLGGINLHGSLLPKYRGAAPVNWAVYNGDQTSGVTVIHMTPKLDGGPCLCKAELEIGTAETAPELEERLAALGPDLIEKSLLMLQEWDGDAVLGEIQDQSEATKAPRLKKSDGNLDFSRPASDLVNQIRAFKPWPKSFTFFHREQGEPIRTIVESATALTVTDFVERFADAGVDLNSFEVGQVVLSNKNELGVLCANSILMVEQIQPAGKRTLEIAEFLRGYAPKPGAKFGPQS